MSCCIAGCPNEGANASKETTYHLFPHPDKDTTRFRQWLAACNNPKFNKVDPMTIHKRYRICRRHFDSDCLKGGCRRLLNTAIPTLYLDQSQDDLSKGSDVLYLPVSQDETKEHFELVVSETKPIVATKEIKLLNTGLNTLNKRKSDEITLPMRTSGNKYGYLKEIHTKHKIKRQRLDTDESKKEVIQRKAVVQVNNPINLGQELEYELLDVDDDKFYRCNWAKNPFFFRSFHRRYFVTINR